MTVKQLRKALSFVRDDQVVYGYDDESVIIQDSNGNDELAVDDLGILDIRGGSYTYRWTEEDR